MVEDPQGAGRFDGLILLLVIAALIGIAWAIVNHASDSSRLQDCIMAGHKNCVPVDDPAPR